MRHFVSIIWIAMAGSICLPAQEAGSDRAELIASLRDPVTIQARIGRDFVGDPVEVTPEAIVLRTRAEGGVVEYTFGRQDVLGLRFPGNRLKQVIYGLYEEGETAEALALLDALYAQRAPFLPFTGETEARYFAETIAWYRSAGRWAEVLARIEALRPFVRDEALLRRFADETLLTLLRLDRPRDAWAAAEQWIAAAGREADSALGWVALAQLQLRAGDGDAALFTLLEPIVFAGGRRVLYLEHAYTLAEATARALGRDALAERLREDAGMRRWQLESDRWDPFPEPDFSSFNDELLP